MYRQQHSLGIIACTALHAGPRARGVTQFNISVRNYIYVNLDKRGRTFQART